MKKVPIILGLVVLVGSGYLVVHPHAPNKNTNDISIAWRFTEENEVGPNTNVTVVINGSAYDMGTFPGSCSEVGANGGIDGKGLLAGELSAAQCWFAGGGNEIGVFAHEDGGVDIMVGELSEGEEGSGLFRGDFNIKNTIES